MNHFKKICYNLQVAKEYLTSYRGPRDSKAPPVDLDNASYLHYLLEHREDMLFTELGAAMMRAGRPGMFSTWMYDRSDLIQASAMAYTERLASEQFIKAIDRASGELKPVLGLLHRLYALDCIERTLGWFAATDSTGLPREAVRAVPDKARELCRQLAPDALALTDAFGFSDEMLSAPIARNWITYNEYDNQGEVTSAP